MLRDLAFKILTIAAIAIGVLGTVTALGFLAAASPNGTPETLRLIKRLMILSLVGGIACTGAGIWLAARGSLKWGALVGVAPMVIFIVTLVWAAVRPSR